MDGKGARDADLVARARAGDLDAFDRLVMRHRVRLFQLARQVVDDAEAAQDAVQEGLLRAYQALAALRDGERFGAWASVIVRRVAQSWVRNGHRREPPVDIQAVTGVFTGAWFAAAAPSDAQERIRDALSALSQRERQVMILHYLEGRTCEEIAAQLRVSAGTVKSILHYSRRKVRKECDEMAEAEKDRKGPRSWSLWTHGDVASERWSTIMYGLGALSCSICLALNKRPKTIEQIAEEVEARAPYVADVVEQLLQIGVVESPRKNQHLLTFIALDAEDWRRLTARVRQPAAEVANRLAQGNQKLQVAFSGTPLASAGWRWEDVGWVIYGYVATKHCALGMLEREILRAAPVWDGGKRYWVGGHESTPDMDWLWTVSMCGGGPGDVVLAHFNTSGRYKDNMWLFQSPLDGLSLLQALLDRPLTEEDVLESLGGDKEGWRSVLAKAVSAGLVEKAGDGFHMAVPVFREADAEILAPAILEVMTPIVRDVVAPVWRDLTRVLDDKGYGHRKDQYQLWRASLTGNVLGEALRFLVEQKVLPRVDEDSPLKWRFVAWKGKLPVADWGMQES